MFIGSMLSWIKCFMDLMNSVFVLSLLQFFLTLCMFGEGNHITYFGSLLLPATKKCADENSLRFHCNKFQDLENLPLVMSPLEHNIVFSVQLKFFFLSVFSQLYKLVR